MVVLSVLMLTSCLFLYVLALVGTILMVKGVSKVSIENWFNNDGLTCCCYVNVCCFKYFEDIFHCGFKVN